MTPTVTEDQLKALAALRGALPADAYLAGGVAIAAALHHRTSRDLDFFLPELAVPVASLEDLACMKLSAIAARGMARDFWDLHALLARDVAAGSLEGALELYRRKYTADDIGHVIRSLVYFGDADAAPLPRGLSAADWRDVKQEFERRALA